MEPHIVRNILVTVVLVALVVVGSYSFHLYKTPNAYVSNLPAKTAESNPSFSVPKAQAQEKTRTVSSSDGTKILTMKSLENEQNTLYTFFASSSAQPFFSQTLTPGYSFGLPDNAWAPGEKYLFIEKNGGGVKTDLVFQADGSSFQNGEQFIDVRDIFLQKNYQYNFAGATGWADSGLLIVETTNANGNTGPSFWFAIPSKAFIQLASHQ